MQQIDNLETYNYPLPCEITHRFKYEVSQERSKFLSHLRTVHDLAWLLPLIFPFLLCLAPVNNCDFWVIPS